MLKMLYSPTCVCTFTERGCSQLLRLVRAEPLSGGILYPYVQKATHVHGMNFLKHEMPGVVVHTCNSSIQEAEGEGN